MIKAPDILLEKKADWLVWIAGAICFLLLFVPSLNKKSNTAAYTTTGNYSAENIDELLLTPEDMIFADKKSFVKGTLRFQWTKDSSLLLENSRENLYNYIYQKKIKKTGRKPAVNNDFSVRPVPQ
jgi:hypothetical protein